jgi:hypothetical protein
MSVPSRLMAHVSTARPPMDWMSPKKCPRCHDIRRGNNTQPGPTEKNAEDRSAPSKSGEAEEEPQSGEWLIHVSSWTGAPGAGHAAGFETGRRWYCLICMSAYADLDLPSIRRLSPTLTRFRVVLGLFIAGLVLSGLTAFPLDRELEFLTSALGLSGAPAQEQTGLSHWILTVRDGLRDTYGKYRWMGYGTDWLAFAHLVLAVFFIGPLIDPVRNVWVLKAGLIACGLVIPVALICGPIRVIPFAWRLIDCSFGVLGAVPLWYCLRLVGRMEAARVDR